MEIIRMITILLKILYYAPLIIFGKKKIIDLIASIGPFYIKLSQIMTTRPDIVDIRIINILKPLQDSVPKSFTPIIEGIEIEKDPFASGSIAQVHRCKINENNNFVIKIKRPNIDKDMEVDRKLLEYLVEMKLVRFVSSLICGKSVALNSKKLVKLVHSTLKDHLDFRNEVENLKIMKKNFENNEKIVIPYVNNNFCSEEMILMEKINGKPLSQVSEKNINRVLEIFLNGIFDMIFVNNFLHGDLHEGNILVLEEETKVCFLDFGAVHVITKDKIFLLNIFFYSLITKNPNLLANYMYNFSVNNDNMKIKTFDKFQSKLESLIKNENFSSLYKFLDNLINICDNCGVLMDESLIMPIVILIEAEGISKKYCKDKFSFESCLLVFLNKFMKL